MSRFYISIQQPKTSSTWFKILERLQICSPFHSNNFFSLNRNILSFTFPFFFKRPVKFHSNLIGATPGDLFNTVTREPSEVIRTIIVKDFDGRVLEAVNVSEISSSTSQIGIYERRHRTFGRCYTINLSKISQKTPIKSLQIN